MSVIQELTPLVDGTLDRLSARAFNCDPLMGPELSRITSVVSSAYKRHGHILEAALKAVLRQHDRFIVWDDPQLPISHAAESLATSYMGNPQSALQASIGHELQGHRTLQVDLLVFDQQEGTIRAYEVKRGAGTHDAGKRRSMLRDLLCTQVVLKSYAEQRLEISCSAAQAHIVIYYGAENLGAPFTLTRETLDEHFGVPVVDEIEEVNSYYRQRIEALLAHA